MPRISLGQSDVPRDTLLPKLNPTKAVSGFEKPPKHPDDNPVTFSKIALGRQLFFDPILSTNDQVACATCHRPEHGLASKEPVAIGIKGRKGTRNAPSILNAAYAKSLTWDGRDADLEAQVLGPLTNENELGNDLDAIIKKLKSDPNYPELFAKAFEVKPETAVTVDHLAKAIASFERVLISGNNGVDRFRRKDYSALSQEARSGMWLFESRGGCWKCHNGPNLSDEHFHNTGVSFGSTERDRGRMLITNVDSHAFQFRTPPLRNVAQTAPYMHDGSIGTLREVVEFYNRGGAPDDPQLDKKLKPLGLTEEEVGFLVAFLEALSGDPVTIAEPESTDERPQR
ncbi:MAG: cytochrome c peroxidase [Planctomycetota bacterium]